MLIFFIREIRLIPQKNVAFVEYADELQAGIAITGNKEIFFIVNNIFLTKGLQGFNLTEENALTLSYAKQ